MAVRSEERFDVAAVEKFLAERAPELGIIDAETTLRLNKPELRARIDRARAADLGVKTQDTVPAFQDQASALEVSVDVSNTGTRAGDAVVQLYAGFPGTPLVRTNAKTAEMIKYTSNAVLATMISFSNEMANLCEAYGADINKVREGMCSDKRIGYAFLHPGLGYGGSCFPKDVRAILKTAQEHDAELRILTAVVEVNRQQPLFFRSEQDSLGVAQDFGFDQLPVAGQAGGSSGRS